MKTSPISIKKFYTDLDKKIPPLYNIYVERNNNKKLSLKDVRGLNVLQRLNYKPSGLWTSEPYSDDPSWISWSVNEELWDFIDPKTSMYYVAKIDFKKILTIDTIKKLKDFHEKYSKKFDDCKYIGIQWDKVAKKYNGIQFKPYFIFDYRKKKNFKYLWYAMLDCQCQCVWNGKSITDFYKLNVKEIMY